MDRNTNPNAGPSSRLGRGMQFNQDATATISTVNYCAYTVACILCGWIFDLLN